MLNLLHTWWRRWAQLLPVALLLAACAGAPASAPPADAEPASDVESKGFTCPEPSPRMEVTSTELNLFVWTEYIPDEIIDCFEEVYGIRVNRDEYSSNEEMYAKLSAGASAYDLVQPTDYIVSLMIRQGLLQELDHEKLPNMGNLDPDYMDQEFDPGNRYTLPYQAGADAIIVNTDVVETIPTSWADLWNPEYAGRMVSIDDARAVIGITLLTMGYDINTTDAAELEAIKPRLAELVAAIRIFDSDTPKTALIAGDADLGIIWTGEAFLAQLENPAIQYIYPEEGAIFWQDTMAIPADAPHADAAYAWINYTLQGDLFWLMLRDFPYSNPNLAALEYARTSQIGIEDADGNPTTPAALYEAYMASNITNTPDEEFAKGHSIVDVGEALPLYDQLWTEVKGE
ncbi:MAG: spermidine/putrescine ABC transporter substrate-binding protein [Caldilineaceae bacterium]|nr:spermidine/putrescine ABC transporter substrate-binding protein [Caldilineaceae bacterium]